MFKHGVNAACINALFSGVTIGAMHESMNRLINVAARQLPPVVGVSAIARALNESAQTVYNWKKRGVSEGGAIKAERVFGVSANFILEGGAERQPTPGVAQSVSHPAPNLTPHAWEKVMNKNVLPTWDAPRWVYVPDDALSPSLKQGDAVELVPLKSMDELQISDVVLVEDAAGNRWLRAYAVDGEGRRWANPLRAPTIFMPFELPPNGLPKVVARMEQRVERRRGI